MQANKGIGDKKEAKKEFQKLRIRLFKKGITFIRFCEQNGVRRQDAEKALGGTWNGEKAKQLRQRLIEASKG